MGGKILELKTDKLIKEIKVGVQKDMIIHLLKKRGPIFGENCR